MVSSTTTFSQEQLELVEPQESAMYEYQTEGFSRKNFRYQFANPVNIGIHDIEVKQGDQSYIDPDSWEMPHGPTAMGETGGSGIQLINVENGSHPTYRFTQGFTELTENAERGEGRLDENRRKVIEGFDFFGDAAWFTGLQDSQGNEIRPGMFKWLKSNIPTERTFDCENFDGDTGDTADLVSTNTQENLIKRYAYETLSGRTNDTGVWSYALGRQSALAKLNAKQPADGGQAPRMSYWDRIQVGDGQNYTNNNVGIRDMMLIPDQLNGPETPPGYDDITIDLTGELGEDELIILPDMNQVRQKYWRLRQMPTPRLFDPIPKEGGQTRFDYAWRYSHSFLPDNRYNNAEDAIHLTNISSLFV